MRTARSCLLAGLLLCLAGAVAEAQVPAAGESRLIEINGTELWVVRMGSGDPMIVVHGGPMLEHGYLLPHLQPLSEDRELVFYDQRLSGRSAGRVEEATVRIATFVDDIEALRMKLGLGRIDLMAHSWGGLLALHYALEYPHNLRSLVLLDSISASSQLRQREEQLLAERISDTDRQRRQSLRDSDAFKEYRSDALAELLRLSFRPQFHDPDRVAELRLYMPVDYRERSAQFGAMMVDLTDFDLHDELRAVSVPALLVYGADEPGLDVGGAALHEALSSSTLVVVDGAGHFPFIEQPAVVLEVVREFLAARAR